VAAARADPFCPADAQTPVGNSTLASFRQTDPKLGGANAEGIPLFTERSQPAGASYVDRARISVVAPRGSDYQSR
jgi:hypothetical protein